MSYDRPEFLSRIEIEQRQLSRLRSLVDTIDGHNAFWTRRLREADIAAADIRSLNDLQRLPLLSKQELVDDQLGESPFGSNLTYPLVDYRRLHQTSGTTGRPMRWLDTAESWNWFLECWQQIYRLVGIRPDDRFAFPFSFGPFIGFWAAFDGAQRFGNLAISLGGMGSEARLKMILEMQATVICCTPTYALRLAEVAGQENIDLAASAVRLLIVAGEPGGSVPAVRERIETAWGARLIDHWGMTDIGSLGVEPEAAPGGLVVLETECLAEIIDPQTLEPVSAGDLGELVITNLGRSGQPVIRYRTGDLVRQAVEPCPSGVHMLRLDGGILGRVDEMVTIRGNNVFPSSLDAILREFPDVAEYRTTVMTRRAMPHLRIEIELATTPAGEKSAEPTTVENVSRTLRDRLNFQAEVIEVPAQSLPRFELKGRRFIRESE